MSEPASHAELHRYALSLAAIQSRQMERLRRFVNARTRFWHRWNKHLQPRWMRRCAKLYAGAEAALGLCLARSNFHGLMMMLEEARGQHHDPGESWRDGVPPA